MNELNQFQPQEPNLSSNPSLSNTPSPQQSTKGKTSLPLILGVFVLILLVGGGVFYMMKFKKPAQIPSTTTVTPTPTQPVFTPPPAPQVNENELLLNDLNSMTNELNQIQLPNLDNEFQSVDGEINQL